jgi:lipopolysaccharide export system permease protein
LAKYDRYVLAQLLAVFGFFSLVLIGTYWINRALGIFDQLIGDGQTTRVFLELVVLFLPQVIVIMIPVSTLAASIYVANRMLNESEMVVLDAAGTTPLRLVRPYIYFGLIVASITAIMSNSLVPVSRTMMTQRQAEISGDVMSKMIVQGQFVHPSSGVSFYVKGLNTDGELNEVFIHDTRDNGLELTYFAKRALILRQEDSAQLVMFDGLLSTLKLPEHTLSHVGFQDLVFDLSALIKKPKSETVSLYSQSTLQLLFPTEAMLEATGSSRVQSQFLAHDRLSQPLHPLVYALLGVAILLAGGFSRFGNFPKIIIAVSVVLFLNILANSGKEIARGNADAWALVYAPLILGLIAAFLLLSRARRPLRTRRSKVTEAAQ